MIAIMTTTPITADLSGGVPTGEMGTEARETDKVLKKILEKIGV
jgi:hypothetical protein